MSKKNILIISGLLSLMWVGYFFVPIDFCGNSDNCYFTLQRIIDSSVVLPVLFACSVLFYFVRFEIFKIWRWFALGWTIVSVVYAYQTPDSYSGFFSGGPWLTSLYMSAWFVGISIAIFIIASLYYRSKTRK